MVKHEAMRRGMLLGYALAKGRELSRADVMRLLQCSPPTATRYMKVAHESLPVERKFGGPGRGLGFIRATRSS